MFTLVAFREDQDQAGAFAAMTGLADTHVQVVADDIRVPAFANKIAAVVGMIDDTVAPELRIESPTLRRKSNLYIAPLNGQAGAAQVMNNPANVCDMRFSPVELAIGENMEAWAEANPAAVQDQTVLVCLTDNPITPVREPHFTVQADSAVAAVANVWTPVAIVFADNLPRGRYQIVGLRGVSASMVACRFIIIGAPNRPGCPGSVLIDDQASDIFRHGNFGAWGEFEDVDQPQIEILCNAADAAQEFYIDLVQLREGAG